MYKKTKSLLSSSFSVTIFNCYGHLFGKGWGQNLQLDDHLLLLAAHAASTSCRGWSSCSLCVCWRQVPQQPNRCQSLLHQAISMASLGTSPDLNTQGRWCGWIKWTKKVYKLHTCVHVCACMHACVHACMCVCVCIYVLFVCVCVFMCICVCMHAHACMHMCQTTCE